MSAMHTRVFVAYEDVRRMAASFQGNKRSSYAGLRTELKRELQTAAEALERAMKLATIIDGADG